MTDPTAARARAVSRLSREDKHHATSLRVERSAVSLVLKHGLDNVTVDMICAQSGISQRTFFNYFKTKTAAIIGVEPPRIDESRARAFIAAPGDDLLPDVLVLMSSMGPGDDIDEQLFADRMRVFSLHPQLLQEQMERMTRLTAEVTDVVYLRLGRGADAGAESDSDRTVRQEKAELLTHAMLGVMRFMALQWVPGHACFPTANTSRSVIAERSTRLTRGEVLESTLTLLRQTLAIPGL